VLHMERSELRCCIVSGTSIHGVCKQSMAQLACVVAQGSLLVTPLWKPFIVLTIVGISSQQGVGSIDCTLRS